MQNQSVVCVNAEQIRHSYSMATSERHIRQVVGVDGGALSHDPRDNSGPGSGATAKKFGGGALSDGSRHEKTKKIGELSLIHI